MLPVPTQVELATYEFEGEDYHLWLGRFISLFASVEGLLNFAVWRLALLNEREHIAKAIFSSLRVDEASNKIGRLIEARKLKGAKINELRFMLDQLGKIAKTRNDLVHLGISHHLRGRQFIIDNVQFAHVKHRVRYVTISPRILRSICIDLIEMQARLFLFCWPNEVSRSRIRRNFPLMRKASWHYTPRVRVPRQRKPRGKTQGPRPQPQPSQP